MSGFRRATAMMFLLASAGLGFSNRTALQIYPSGPTIPENLLRIETRFAVPPRVPLSIRNVKLFDAEDREIDGAFLDLTLPNADGKRVTILLHPGRVKSGLNANSMLGRALRPGSSVTLLVEHPDLDRPVRKSWEVTEFDAASPQPTLWTIEPPHKGRRTPLILHLDAPISSAAEVMIAIRGPHGLRVAGTTQLEASETVWRFIPDQPWNVGTFAVVIHPDLEDPAGNRWCARFEMANGSATRCDTETVLTFKL